MNDESLSEQKMWLPYSMNSLHHTTTTDLLLWPNLIISRLHPNPPTLTTLTTMTAGDGRSKVAVYAKSTAVGATPVKPGKTYPLSLLDHAMARHSLHLVFYYRPGPTINRDRLKESLSDVLSHYPAMTGRLMRGEDGGWVVKCTDAGVRLLDASAEGTVEEWLASASAAEEAGLAYWDPMLIDPSIWSPYYVQITEFEDKGFAIGLSCTHMHADPNCAMLFIKAWGDAHRRAHIAHAPFLHPPAFLPRSSPNTATPSAAFLAAKSSSSPAVSAKMSSATFRFSDEAVKSCLAELHQDATPFDALAALFWCRIAAAGGGGATSLTLAIDFRKLMHAPLPHGFYGNALHFSSVRANPNEGWVATAAAITAHTTSMPEEEYWSAVDWFGSRKAEAGAFQMYGPELTFVRLDHVMAYEAAFERGEKPVHVTCRAGGVEGEGVVMVLPSPEEGAGRTVVATLPEEVMDGVLKDEAILKYGPTVMLGGKV